MCDQPSNQYIIIIIYFYHSFVSSIITFRIILISAGDCRFTIRLYISIILLPVSFHHSRPLCAIFTTSGWPLLTHHGRPLSPTGFSSRVKNDNRHPEGCEVSHRNGWCPDLLSSALAYIAHLWHRTLSEGKLLYRGG